MTMNIHMKIVSTSYPCVYSLPSCETFRVKLRVMSSLKALSPGYKSCEESMRISHLITYRSRPLRAYRRGLGRTRCQFPGVAVWCGDSLGAGEPNTPSPKTHYVLQIAGEQLRNSPKQESTAAGVVPLTAIRVSNTVSNPADKAGRKQGKTQ